MARRGGIVCLAIPGRIVSIGSEPLLFRRARVAFGTLVGYMFRPIAIPIGMVLAAVVFFAWFWSNSITHRPPYSPRKDNPTYGDDGEEISLQEAQSEI